uniref:MAM domain containing 4 n=1 Tax=Junco hyemalis TaxID=40217 RepID=A0A8C5JT67_JUNHY
ICLPSCASSRTVLPSGSVVVNSCSSAAEQLCNFVCDCSDCSDENQCGGSVLGTPFTCDFEDSDCGWQDVGTSTYGWVRGRASLAKWDMGPHSDHTVGTDLGKWELLGEQALGTHTKTTATAWLRSPEMREAAATCEIRAWYHLSGRCESTQGGHRQHWLLGSGGDGAICPCGRDRTTDTLRWVLATLFASSTLHTRRWWDLGVPVPTPRAGGSHCHRGSCLAQRRFCDGTDDCGDNSDEGAAQCSEHPWPQGGVLWIASHSPSVGCRGLCAPALRAHPPPNPQLVLYCHLHGSATSTLSISYVTNSTKHLMRERTGDLGSCWVRERVDFDVADPFKVSCCWAGGSRAALGSGTTAVDRGSTTSQAHCGHKPLVTLPSQARAGPCAADEVACDSGGCIAAELACDFAHTCADGSDEERCGESPDRHCPSRGGDQGLAWLGHVGVGPQPSPHRVFLCSGTFLALQTGEGQMVGPAKARSPLLGPSGPACTMEMSYHIHSDPQGNLLPTPGCPACFLLPDPPCLPAFTASPKLSCNFERGMCGWYQDLSSDFKWVHSTGQGQGSDHTTGSGYFLSVDASVPWSHGQRALLLSSHQEPAAAPRCLSFWYRLAGPQIGTLSLKLWPEGGEEEVLWTRRGTQGSIWHRARATLPSTDQRRYRVAFEVLHDGFLGDVGLDDITQTAGPCGAQLSCSFEVEGCGLAASREGTWQRQSNGTGTTAGPVADHTTGTAAGHYMVVNTGRVSLPAGHTAALTSQPYQPSVSAQCLAFWYQLSAGTPGSLRVFVEQSRVRRKVLSVSTMEGSSWHRSHVTVQPDGDWQVVFEAVGAGGDHGYIALDDLHVSEGACPKPASCDFEQDTCGWSSPSDPRLHSLAWGWKSGVTLAKYPGPEQDHTLGTRNGHYMHFDTSVLGATGTSALLESPPLPAATDSCLRFWYHMDIPEHLSGGELRVALRGAGGQRTVWSVPGHRGRGWRGAAVPVQSPGEFQVSGATLGCGVWPMEGTVALDDIMYSARVGCHSSPESPVEGAGKRGVCVCGCVWVWVCVCSSGCERSTQSCPGCWAEAGGSSLGSGSK